MSPLLDVDVALSALDDSAADRDHSVAVCSEKAFSKFPIVRRAAGHSAMS